MPVLGGHQVLLDDVGTEVEGVLVGAERVLGPVPGGAAVSYDVRNRQVPVAAPARAAALRGRSRLGP